MDLFLAIYYFEVITTVFYTLAEVKTLENDKENELNDVKDIYEEQEHNVPGIYFVFTIDIYKLDIPVFLSIK